MNKAVMSPGRVELENDGMREAAGQEAKADGFERMAMIVAQGRGAVRIFDEVLGDG